MSPLEPTAALGRAAPARYARRMARAAQKRPRAVDDDPTIYPIEDDMGEDSLQLFIDDILRQSIEHWLASRGKPTFVGSNQFIYWVQHHPKKCVAPDVYVLPGLAPDGRVRCLKTWEAGLVPSFAFEVVSSNDVDKDYRDAPKSYDELGVKELVIFDPDFAAGRDRLRFQVYRRLARRGLSRVEVSNGDRVRSRVLGCFLRAVGYGDQVRVRLASGPTGDDIVPTPAEAEREKAEAEREKAEAEREKAEAARARAATIEAENVRLRAELERLRSRK
jgi:Uma2 family endonuclease